LVSGGFGIHHGDDDPAEVLPGQVEERQFRDCAGMIGGALVRRVVAIDGMVSKRKKEKKKKRKKETKWTYAHPGGMAMLAFGKGFCNALRMSLPLRGVRSRRADRGPIRTKSSLSHVRSPASECNQ
jgi:hypothetical protein